MLANLIIYVVIVLNTIILANVGWAHDVAARETDVDRLGWRSLAMLAIRRRQKVKRLCLLFLSGSK